MGLRLISFASYGDNYNMVVYCPASQYQKKKTQQKILISIRNNSIISF